MTVTLTIRPGVKWNVFPSQQPQRSRINVKNGKIALVQCEIRIAMDT